MANKTVRAREEERNNSRRLKAIAKENRTVYRAFRETEKYLASGRVEPSSYAAEMKNPENLLEVEGLKSYFYTDIGIVKAVDGVSLDIPLGKTVGIVGESGCGKSVLSLSVIRLLQGPVGQIAGGQIRFLSGEKAVDLAKISEEGIRKIRGREISMIFQESMTSLNPVFTVGRQIDEAIAIHMPEKSKDEVRALSIETLETVSIANAERIYKAYPHELSGGMRQRVMIAMALSCNPRLIIADEPTTALDVTIQAQILELMREIRQRINASIMLITHDLGVVAEMADLVSVMYAGRIIEQGTVTDVLQKPLHPYTVGLLRAKPVAGKPVDALYSIPGQVPNPVEMPDHCYFKSRCDRCIEQCGEKYPETIHVGKTHQVACWLYR